MAGSLAEAAERERAVIDNVKDVVCSLDSGFSFMTVSPSCQSMLGYLPDELLGKRIVDLFSEPKSETLAASFGDLDSKGSNSCQVRMTRKDGSIADILISSSLSKHNKSIFCVLHDFTERAQAERMKQQVVAIVTHDLKTPVTTVKHVLEMFDAGIGGEFSEEGRNMLVRAELSADTMLDLINDLLDLEKIKAGMLELRREEVELMDLLEECIQLTSGLAEKRAVFVVAGGSKALKAFADRSRLRQVIVNLISNAVKYCDRGKAVNLVCEQRGDGLWIEVKDEGCGIPNEKISTIFEPFQQVSTSDQNSGSGLGLAICQALVGLHGGTITVESTPGAGSTFKVRLPLMNSDQIIKHT